MAKILLIDDDDAFRETLKEMLERAEHVVIDVPDGRQGIKTYEAHSFDLVISDIFMPEEDGIGVLNALKKKGNQTKIIMISGGGTIAPGQYLGLAEKLGADRVLDKPFSKQDMLKAIDELVGE